MARIEVATRIRCDRCGCVFPEDVHHGRVVIAEGFGDLRGSSGHICTVEDLCDSCLREVRKCACNQTEMEIGE